MAKWFKEFPINLKNGGGADRTRGKLGMVASIGTKVVKGQGNKNPSEPNGVGSLLSGSRHRKNSAIDQEGRTERNGGDANLWDSLLPGKSRKNSKTECVTDEQQQRTPKSSANAYISRLIRVDKQDRSPNFTSPVVPEKPPPQAQHKTETVRPNHQLYSIT